MASGADLDYYYKYFTASSNRRGNTGFHQPSISLNGPDGRPVTVSH